ncbi:MAG: tRNA pseudouridine(55) synthase TruB [Symploca sp. SIO3C6]|nr:tRNA pseudouridine(55) synthase TruB [Symploca sp. SIO3C6]
MEGFLNLNKPTGFTSHDCVGRVRRLLRMKRVGHGGTLDPAATGVLPIALGKATRLLQYLQSDKAYQATIRLGVKTTTDDLEGEIVATESAAHLSLENVKSVLGQFKGKIKQVPPIYSAIQVKGKRLYNLARAGETVEVPERIVEVYQIQVLAWHPGEFPEIDLAISCGTGTYIRSIARDLGAALNSCGVLASLRRTKSSGFELSDSLSLGGLEKLLAQENFQPILPAKALAHLTVVSLSLTESQRWCQGQRLPWKIPSTDISTDALRIHCEDGDFLGIGKVVDSEDGWLLVPQMVFRSF